jgi:hypothetical protein
MAIAAVTRISGIDPARMEEEREVVIASSDKGRAMDGCEAFITLLSADGTNALAIIIWKDQASQGAYTKVRGELVANVERDSKAASGATIGEPELYDVIYWK